MAGETAVRAGTTVTMGGVNRSPSRKSMAMARRWTPQRFVTLRRIRVIACIAATSIALAGSFAFTARKSVALNINGQTTQSPHMR